MNIEKIRYAADKTLQDVVEDGFEQIEEGEGFEYTIGEIAEGKFKLVFEPSKEEGFVDYSVIDGLGYTLIFED